MFDTLSMPPADKILSLMPVFRADPRPDKIDLGVGVYRDASGVTPIMRVVREAEQRIHAGQTTKAYVGPAGDAVFCQLMTRLVFGDAAPVNRLRAVQTPGGAGALSVLAGLVALARPAATIHVPDPTWVNHVSIFQDHGLKIAVYPYFDAATGLVDFSRMAAYLGSVAAGDLVLLHGCCHNPTGADLDHAQWHEIADLLVARQLTPFVDLAYQGFGDGLDADAFGVRLLAARVPEMLVASSCSKNFGIYRERTGTAFALATASAEADVALGHMVVRARTGYSMPPDHGSALVRAILEDPLLASEWRAELDGMRNSVLTLREALAAAFRRFSNSLDYEFLRAHKGMFSLIGTTPAQVARLRDDHAIYIVDDGRINIAGLRADQVDRFAQAVLAVRA